MRGSHNARQSNSAGTARPTRAPTGTDSPDSVSNRLLNMPWHAVSAYLACRQKHLALFQWACSTGDLYCRIHRAERSARSPAYRPIVGSGVAVGPAIGKLDKAHRAPRRQRNRGLRRRNHIRIGSRAPIARHHEQSERKRQRHAKRVIDAPSRLGVIFGYG